MIVSGCGRRVAVVIGLELWECKLRSMSCVWKGEAYGEEARGLKGAKIFFFPFSGKKAEAIEFLTRVFASFVRHSIYRLSFRDPF